MVFLKYYWGIVPGAVSIGFHGSPGSTIHPWSTSLRVVSHSDIVAVSTFPVIMVRSSTIFPNFTVFSFTPENSQTRRHGWCAFSDHFPNVLQDGWKSSDPTVGAVCWETRSMARWRFVMASKRLNNCAGTPRHWGWSCAVGVVAGDMVIFNRHFGTFWYFLILFEGSRNFKQDFFGRGQLHRIRQFVINLKPDKKWVLLLTQVVI